MLVLRDPGLTCNIADHNLRALIEQRFEDICAGEEYEYDVHGYMIVVEPGDPVEALEKESGCPVVRDYCNDALFGDPEFRPCFDVLEEHPFCYEMVFVPGCGDFGIVIFIPKAGGIDSQLLAVCAEYAVPAP